MTRIKLQIFVVLALLAMAAAASSMWLTRQETTTALAQERSSTTTNGDLAQRINAAIGSAAGPVWVRYETDSQKPFRGMCGGFNEHDLDQPDRWNSRSDDDDADPTGRIAVFVRAENRKATRIEVFDSRCTVKASATSIRDLGSAGAEEAVAYLAGLMPAASRDTEKLGKRIVFAVAFHGTPTADDALLQWAGDSWPMKIRRDAAFWMGSARGERGFKGLVELAARPGDTDFRKHVVFAISLNKGEDGTAELLRLAKSGEPREVRRAAIFWLSQRASKAAVDGLEQIVANDPDAKLREHAVFALSQLPDEEGVPKLIRLAKTHRDPGVRKKAIFWLSQKDDPRVLGFLEDVLAGNGGN